MAGELRGARTSLDDALSADGPGAETELAEDDEDPVEVSAARVTPYDPEAT